MIIAELGVLAIAVAFGAALPQAGNASGTELARLHDGGLFVASLVKVFALDHIFSSGWFLAITATAAISLAIGG